MITIPKQLCNEKFKFITTYPCSKKTSDQCIEKLKNPKITKEEKNKILALYNKPKRPLENKWQTENNYTHSNPEFKKYLETATGYGVVCGYGSLAVIDADTKEVELAVTKNLPKTFVVESGSGGFHFYYIVKDLENKIVLQTGEGKNRKHYGEVQFTGSQVIGSGSLHPNGKKYKIKIKSDIATITKDELTKVLADFIEDKEYTWNDGSDTDISKIAGEIQGLTRHGDELQGSHPIHGSEGGMNFTINTEKNLWHCFRCNTGGDTLSLIAIMEKIATCSEVKNGIPKNKFEKVLKVAKEKYGIEKVDRSEDEIEELTNEELDELKNPNLLFNIIIEVHKHHVGEYDSIMAMTCQGTTRLVVNVEPESQNLMVTGESGCGKDRLTAYLFMILIGNKKYFHLAKLSPEGLTYAKQKIKNWTWDGKVVVVEDPTPEVINSQGFKTFLSGRGKKGYTVGTGGKSIEINVKGKPVFVITTARSEGENEAIRRLPSIQLDNSPEISRETKIFQAKRAMGKLANIKPNKVLISALSKLKPYEVVIPYADCLVDLFPDTVLMRTYFQRFLDYIKASTVLFQEQREQIDGKLIATPEDYDVARVTMMKTITNAPMIPLNSEEQRIYDLFKNHTDKSYFRYMIMDELGIDVNLATSTLMKFKRHGIILTEEKFNDRANRLTTNYKMISSVEMMIPTWLIVGEIANGSVLVNKGQIIECPTTKNKISRRKIEDEFWSSGSVGIYIGLPELWKKYYDPSKTLYQRDKEGGFNLFSLSFTFTSSTTLPTEEKVVGQTVISPPTTPPLFDEISQLREFICHNRESGFQTTYDMLVHKFGNIFIDKAIKDNVIVKNSKNEYDVG